MLGRTDSRARALLLLVAFVVVAGSLGVRLAYWQVARRDELAAMAVKQSSMRYEIPSRRGSIYDRTGTVVLATSVDRDRLAAYPKLLTPERRAAGRRAARRRCSASRATPPTELTARMTSEREYVVLARDLDPTISDRIRELSAGDQPELVGRSCSSREPVRVYPQPGGGPDTTLAAHLLGFVNRDGAGQYGVEQFYQDQLAGMPARRRRPEGRGGQRRARLVDRHRAGLPRGRTCTLTIDAVAPGRRRAGAPRGMDRRPREAGLGRRHGPLHAARSSPTRATPRTTPTTTRRSRATDPGRFIDPIVSHGLRARVGVQDAHRDGGDRQRGRDAETRSSRDTGKLRVDGGRAHVDDADHLAMGRMTFADARRLLAQRRRREGRARARQDHPRVVGRSCTTRGAAWASGRRPASTSPTRSAGHRARPGGHPVARDRPRQRRLRPGRRRHADPARAGVRGDGQRRDARPAAGRPVDRRRRDRARSPRAG